jgi:hypothetical protein
MMSETEDPDFPPPKMAPPPDVAAHETDLYASPKKDVDGSRTNCDPPDPCFEPPENTNNGHDSDTGANDTYSDIGGHTDLNSSLDQTNSDPGTREEELNDSDDVPEINTSTLSFKENGNDSEEPKKTWSGSTEPVEEGVSRLVVGGKEAQADAHKAPVEIKPVPIGDQKLRSKLRFDVVTAKVREESGKKYVVYSIMMKRAGGDSHPAVIERRYNHFCSLYERILCTFHPSILGDFQFPKKVIIGNFKAETITERTDAFHKFLNLIAANDKLLYSDYFHAFLCSDEQNEAVSYIKLGRYSDAAPLLETIFYVREKLVTISHVSVLEVLIELVGCLAEIEAEENAYRYALVAAQCVTLLHGHPEVNRIKIPFLQLSSRLASTLGHDPRPYNKQLSELRYAGVKTSQSTPLLEVIREKYIHTATRTSKTW